MTDPIERTVRYVTTVDDLPGAWSFVMTWLDRVGDRPSIRISPITIFTTDEIANVQGAGQRRFEVTVEGMQEVTGG